MVQQSLKQGLKRRRVLHKSTPNYVVEWLTSEHNKHHSGSGETALGVIAEALKVESAWKRKCVSETITSRHENYQKLYDNFVRHESATFADSAQYFSEAKALARTLETYDAQSDFQEWYLARGDFLNTSATPFACVSAMNAMAVMIVKRMRNFYSKSDVKVVLLEAPKFCVARHFKFFSGYIIRYSSWETFS